jgi:hypothetical protein
VGALTKEKSSAFRRQGSRCPQTSSAQGHEGAADFNVSLDHLSSNQWLLRV